MEDKRHQTRPKRVFVNDVNGYSSAHIAKFLSTYVAEDGEAEEEAAAGEAAFQVVGTVQSAKESAFLLEQYQSPSRDELLQYLLQCDVVVYNISESSSQQQFEEAKWALTALESEMENFKSRKMFILVSTVMTWALTTPKNPGDAMTDAEFRRRRPHRNFKNCYNLENLVLKLPRGKNSKLQGYVVAAGHQYGQGENLFHYFFKVSWLMKSPEVPIFGEGRNHIPTIHVHDLGGVIQNIIKQRPKSKYILAIDEACITLEDIVKRISYVLGPGKVHMLPAQEVITMKAFTPGELEYLGIDLSLEASQLKDLYDLRWTSETGMVENMEMIVQEYKEARQLLPVRILLVGPPAVGKTTVAEKLCQYYRTHHIKLQETIEEKITQLKEILNGPEHDSEEEAAAAQKQLESIKKSMEANEGRLDDHLLFHIVNDKLNSKACQNQGFVLDDFPDTYQQAKMIFSDKEPDNQDMDLMSKTPAYNKNIAPEHIFALHASDDFLTNRVKELPQSLAEKMRYTQEEFLCRLMRYRQLSSTGDTLLDYFDELEIHPEHIEVCVDDPEYTDIMKKITEMVGVPTNYGLSAEEQEKKARKRDKEQRQKLAAEASERKRRNEAALAEMAAQYKQWQKNVCEVRRQEAELLEAQSLPLRNYLMKYVIPSLTEAMLECCKIKPEDPVDFLAEYLLRSIQQG
ncbi:adenylate kinase 7-like [Parambassis ranga]|uniref:Adenylate kinase 7-like n=1 Tax=Parambassis ranga TaxID=210632 RepID=A0A6P7HML4_9TELE|nr:adenylate kinase 7-like [Parambassis ranga]